MTVLLVASAIGCGGEEPARVRSLRGNGVVVDSSSPSLSEAERQALGDAMVERFVLDWGELGPGLDYPSLERTFRGPVPRGAEVTLLVRGRWEHVEGPDERLTGLARELAGVVAEAEAEGALVRSWLFALDAPRPDAALGKTLATLHRSLGDRRTVGLLLPPAWLAGELPSELVQAPDYLAAWVYGEDVGHTELSVAAWELDETARRVARLEEVGRPYLTVLSISGSLRDSGGRVVAVALPEGLTPAGGVRVTAAPFAFEGYFRQRLAVQAVRAVTAGGEARVGPGSFELSRPTAEHTRQAVERVRALAGAKQLGLLFADLRKDGDGLGMGVGGLADALGGAATGEPELTLDGDADGLTLTIENVDRPTAVATKDHNYVDLVFEGSLLGVEAGEFPRYRLLASPADSNSVSERRARVVRLHFDFLEAGERRSSGPIRFARTPPPKVSARAHLLSALGTVVEPEPVTWPPP